MRVTISSSSNDLIAEKYKEEARKIVDFLASSGCDLNWGSGEFSIMGICYNEFVKHNRKIYGYTSPKYLYELDNLNKATHSVYDTTFDLKKNIFNDADFIVLLPGGTGTISEFFAYLEEIRSNDQNKPLILCNETHHFDSALSLIDDLVKRNFNSESIYDYIKVANSFDEFKKIFNEIKNS